MTERRFKVMGSAGHLVVVGGPDDLADHLEARARRLESLWSRFLADSEISRYNRSGRPWRTLDLSPETQRLLDLSERGSELTADRFDPWVGEAMHDIGYGASFETIAAGIDPGAPVDPNPTAGFDPGAIGKGLAADIVVEEALAAGATGILASFGGDLRVAGESPDGGPWRIDVESPGGGSVDATLSIAHGAVATSTPLKRRWTVDGSERHHVIDPTTGTSAVDPMDSVTVVANAGWQAEVLCTLLVLDAVRDDAALALVESLGAAASVWHQGVRLTTARWADFALVDALGAAATKEAA